MIHNDTGKVVEVSALVFGHCNGIHGCKGNCNEEAEFEGEDAVDEEVAVGEPERTVVAEAIA